MNAYDEVEFFPRGCERKKLYRNITLKYSYGPSLFSTLSLVFSQWKIFIIIKNHSDI